MIRKVCLALIIGVFCYLPVFAESTSWYWLFSTDEMTYYLDNTHVFKDENCAIIWTKCVISGTIVLMQWHVTKDGRISWIYGRSQRPDGSFTYTYPDASKFNKSVDMSIHFKQIYSLIWGHKKGG